MHRVRTAGSGAAVRLLGSGTIPRDALAAAELLEADFAIPADVWSVTRFTELARDGMDAERHATLNPTARSRTTWVQRCLGGSDAPVVAATGYGRAVAEQIRPHVPAPYRTLRTDGYGRSDTRPVLRSLFEVDRHSIVVAALASLGDRDATRAAIDPQRARHDGAADLVALIGAVAPAPDRTGAGVGVGLP
jgi:pyruvate dehydrogenase E1 component